LAKNGLGFILGDICKTHLVTLNPASQVLIIPPGAKSSDRCFYNYLQQEENIFVSKTHQATCFVVSIYGAAIVTRNGAIGSR
jgi:hypothetical protein